MPSPPTVSASLIFGLVPLYLLATSAIATAPEPLHIYPGLSSLPVDSKARQIYPEGFYPGGGYVRFPWGRTRYWVMGPEGGRKIVLIHGLTIPAIVWQHVAPDLAKRGFRVLVYDLYGRAYSDAPRTTYHTALYTTQLALLMQYLKWDKAIIVGFSMGGAIAAAFTSQFPQLVENKVVFIASAGAIEPLSTTARFLSSPFVRNVVDGIPFKKSLQQLFTTSTADESSSTPVIEIVKLQSAHLPYFTSAVASSLRDGPIRGEHGAFGSEEFIGREVLLVHGTKDTIVPPHRSTKILSLLPPSTQENPKTRIVMIEGGGHDLPISRAGELGRVILDFLE